ncbi:MAG: preprotein translocase subunit YajC [Saprospiraceae bacterium]|jgi:preprotein translocase subunit YajC|nr:preprotein translocase subunit YajC [Saprospiraceae bacterium]MBK6477661.1 preprotein translocase subunit YajC [Saprospiraceae bacterium]MBK6816467.1 preprotein translocase subunit YajC [Saprospiraceae bacterium]MBK7370991.1 preprotein translocase subunit YajC [Saprospiraceae bacterium]MBK7436508.1 preprotein translocase subunit YajC [Saprospiraceae bacterium]
MLQLIILQAASGGGILNLLMFPILLVIMYFFFIRPQQKRQKDQAKFQTEIKKGDDIVTLSGIIGRVNKIEGDIVSLQIDTKSYINVVKSAISKDMTESYRKGTPAKME